MMPEKKIVRIVIERYLEKRRSSKEELQEGYEEETATIELTFPAGMIDKIAAETKKPIDSVLSWSRIPDKENYIHHKLFLDAYKKLMKEWLDGQ